MLAHFRPRRPSHGTVVAYLALFVALGGTGYAASGANSTQATTAAKKVTTSYVKKTAKVIADREISTKARTLSVNHANTASKLARVTLVRTDGPALGPNNSESVDAFCPSGKQPIAGGGRTDASPYNTAIVASRPVVAGDTTVPGTGDTLQGWRVTVLNNAMIDPNIDPLVWVVCAG